MTKSRSKKIIEKLKEYYGNPETILSFNNIYELVIAVVLSAQTTDKQVNSVIKDLFSRYSDFHDLSLATQADVEDIIRSVGLYRSKAKNIINLSIDIIKNHNGKVPDSLKELVHLPGIGRKTANVILSLGFGKPAFAVDTHILRIAGRIGYINSNNPNIVEKAITSYIPKDDWISAHLLFIKHGRSICVARNPLCDECPINPYCDASGNIS
ncbi:MAG: endonuclease III [Spirochaetota bacterium]|nr:endonuclease III [Spirochaetota bacterium]